jgi:hypothetical protein
MRKYIILFFLVFPFLFACNSGGGSDDVLPEDQMVSVLTAVHMADGRLVSLSQAPDTLYKYGTARYLAVFQQFHTDSAQFRKSYQYYSTQPDKFVAIYDKVLKTLQAKTDSLNKLLAKQNIMRPKQPVRPNAITSGKNYGVGIQPQVPAPTQGGGAITPAMRRSMFKKDSIMRAHLRKRHVISPIK